MIEKEKIQLRLDLQGDLAEKFKAIKQRKGIVNNTDVVRFIINEAYEDLPTEKEA